MLYKRHIVDKLNGFDERFEYLEDRELAIRALKHGRILFNPEMKVYHQKITLKPRYYINTGKRMKYRALIYKLHKDKPNSIWRVIDPLNLMAVLFPPFVFFSLIFSRYKTKDDFILFPFIYVRLLYERLNLWYYSWKEKVFLI
jgi:GT2 family glycosyltransferase